MYPSTTTAISYTQLLALATKLRPSTEGPHPLQHFQMLKLIFRAKGEASRQVCQASQVLAHTTSTHTTIFMKAAILQRVAVIYEFTQLRTIILLHFFNKKKLVTFFF